MEDHCRQLRNAQREASTQSARQLYRARYLSHALHGDGSATISVELPREGAELVFRALEMALAAISGPAKEGAEAEADEETLFARQADALVEMARGYLAGGRERASCTADHYQVVVHVDERALRGEPGKDGKSDLPIER